MQIFYKTDRTQVLEAAPGASVADVKAAIEASCGFPAEEQRVVFAGKQLEDSELLSAAGVEEEATLQILGRLLGGGKKRKKKTYTKPKKIKHKRKHVKAADWLKLRYKVDDSGKIQRLRKACPNCGPGTMLANHDKGSSNPRLTCGLCHARFVFTNN